MPTVIRTAPGAISVDVSEEAVVVELADGRTVSTPLAWYPRLIHATLPERRNVRIIGSGKGLHWPDVQEDISVGSMLLGTPSMERPGSLKRWLAVRRDKVS